MARLTPRAGGSGPSGSRPQRESRAWPRRPPTSGRGIAREPARTVVAHSLSVMVVQSGRPRAASSTAEPLIRRSTRLGAVEESGRLALGELRRLLGPDARTTRRPPSGAPQPGLAGPAARLRRARPNAPPGCRPPLDVIGEAGRAAHPGSTLAAYPRGPGRRSRTPIKARPTGSRAPRWSVPLGRRPPSRSRSSIPAGRRCLTPPGGARPRASSAWRERVGLYGGELHTGAGPDGGLRRPRRASPRPAMGPGMTVGSPIRVCIADDQSLGPRGLSA